MEETFHASIKRYTDLKLATNSLIAEIPALSPEKILARSTQLSTMQHKLVQDDEQIFAILSLAGPEIYNANFVESYRHILNETLHLLDQLRDQICDVKKNLLIPPTTHRILDTSRQG